MILAGFFSILLGFALVAGFRVWILVPATMLALTLFVILTWLTPIGVSSAVVHWLVSAVGLQVGYFLGVLQFRPESSQSPIMPADAKFVGRDRRGF